MPTPTNAQIPPAVMDLQDPEANSLVLDFLFRNSFNDIATEFQKLPGIYEDLEIYHSGLKLEHLLDDLFMKSIVYDFLQRKAHKKIAVEFKLQFGPFRDLDGLTLEKLFVMYKKDLNVIVSNEPTSVLDMETQALSCVKTSSSGESLIPSSLLETESVLDMETEALIYVKTSSSAESLIPSSVLEMELNSNKPENIHVPSNSHTLIKSKKEANSLVFDFLVRHSHFEVAYDFLEFVGPLEDVKDGPILEEILTDYNIKKNEEKYPQIANSNDDHHDHIQTFQPKAVSQLDQVKGENSNSLQPFEESELDHELSDENFDLQNFLESYIHRL